MPVTITDLPNATTPLSGTERVPMDQSGATKDASTLDIANLAGAAITAAVAAHAAAANPHPTYLTQTEGDALYAAIGVAVASDVTGITGADRITNMVSLTQAEYNAITPNASTFYVIV